LKKISRKTGKTLKKHTNMMEKDELSVGGSVNSSEKISGLKEEGVLDQENGGLETSSNERGKENTYSSEESEQGEEDEAKLRKVREMLKTFEEENLSDKPQEASWEMVREEKLDKVLNREGSFDEKFALLKELKEERFEFEIEGFINNLSQKMADSSGTKEKREEFIGNIAEAIRKARDDERLPADFFEGLDGVISVGSGHGENPFGILRKYMSESRVILIDPDATPAKAIAEDERVVHLGQRFEDVNMSVKPDEKNLVEASNFLQLYETKEEKIAMLKKMIKLAGIGGKLLIVDEVKRGGLGGKKDWAMNRGFNAFKGNYARLNPGEYEKIFADLELKCFTNGEKDQYDRGSVLFTLEVTPEAMAQATKQ